MDIEWLLYLDNIVSTRLHAFPTNEKKHGDWSLCGRGAGSKKVKGGAPKCGKCLEMLSKFPMPMLEEKREKDKKDKDYRKKVLKGMESD